MKLTPHLRDFMDALPFLADRGPLLALVHDGFSLSGALIARRKNGLAVLGRAESRAVHFSVALADIVRQLGGKPQRAILSTAAAALALLDLPVEADKPRGAREMESLVRWEMEPLLAEQAGVWTLGNLLVGRGYLGREAQDELVRELSERQAESAAQGGQAPVRFGELAQERGWVSREQVEECAALQGQLRGLDDQVLCGWEPAPTASREERRVLWLACAIGLPVQARWLAACERLDMRLEAIYPLAGASLPLFAGARGLILEVHPTSVVVLRREAGGVASVASRPLGHRDPLCVCLELLNECLVPDDRELFFYPGAEFAATLAEPIAAAIVRPLKAPLAEELTQLPLLSGPPLLAISRQFLRRGEPILPRLPGSEPLPPVAKRPQTWIAAAVGALVAFIAVYEASAALRQSLLRQEVRVLSDQRAKADQARAKIAQDEQEAKKAQAELDRVKAQMAAVQAELDFFVRELGGRDEFLAQGLQALQESVSSEVVVDDITESGWFQLSVTAWSLSQQAGYRFARDLAQALAAWDFQVKGLEIKETRGRLNQPGYGVLFKLVRAKAPEAAASGGKKP